MLANRSLWLMACAAVLVLGGGTGCGKKKTLDKTVDGLVEALQKGDFDAFKGLCSPGLAEKVAEADFERMSKAFVRLGKFEDRTMKGIEVKSGAPDEGRYDLDFERGEVHLEIKVDDDVIYAFDFTGDAIETALKEAAQEKYAEFAVFDFQFVDKKSGRTNPRGNVFAKGGPVAFHFAVSGVQQKDGHFYVKVGLRTKGADGKVQGEKPDFLDARMKAEDGQPPVVTINGSFPANIAGPAQMELDILDVPSGKSMTYSQGIVVE